MEIRLLGMDQAMYSRPLIGTSGAVETSGEEPGGRKER